MNPDLFVDPAIVSLSQVPTQRPPLAQQKSTLEPGSALSKLLDSAMANAAKEETPELSERSSAEQPVNAVYTAPLVPSLDWMLTFVPECKRDLAHVYTIQTLLQMHSDPAVANFDTAKLPPQTFFHIRPKTTQESNRGATNTLKRNRRANGKEGAAIPDFNRPWEHSKPKQAWDRRPGGFLKQTELETMSRDKISQLLGESPNEDIPEWDSPVDNAPAGIDMGSTVEDFERWKQLMRNEEKIRNGEPVSDFQKGNDVDSFFSFVKSGDVQNKASSASLGTSVSLDLARASVKDSSKFSSFFGASPQPRAQRSSVDSSASQQDRTDENDNKSGTNSSGRVLRFFQSDQAQNSPSLSQPSHPHTNPPANQPQNNPGMRLPKEGASPGYPRGPGYMPPPGIPVPGSAPPPGFPGLARHSSSGAPPPPPPGLQGPPGPMGPLGPPGPQTGNDNFFFSLLQKRNDEAGPGGEGNATGPKNKDQKNEQSFPPPGMFPGQPGNGPHSHPFYGHPPPGMFPSGMPHQNLPAHLAQGQGQNARLSGTMQPATSNQYGGHPLPGKPGPPQKGPMPPQFPQMHSEMGAVPGDLPPWMRMPPGPNGQAGAALPYSLGPGGFPRGQGFPPGLGSNPDPSQRK